MEYDILDFASEIIDMATDNYYKMEALRGYCKYLEGDSLSSTMAATLLDEICYRQKEIITKIDTYSTKIGVEMLSGSSG